MFELSDLTRVKVLDVRTLTSKERKPDELPGAQMLLQATLGAGVLAMFDGFLPGMFYRRAQGKKQGELDGIETAELTGVGEHVKRLPWVYEQTGCNVTIDIGMGGSSNIVLSDVKAYRVSLQPQAAGVVVQWTIDALGLSDSLRGKLSGLKRTEVQMLMFGPEVEGDGQSDIEDEPPAPKQKRNRAAAPAASDGEKSKAALDAGGKSPFPNGGAKTDAEIAADGPESALLRAHGGETAATH